MDFFFVFKEAEISLGEMLSVTRRSAIGSPRSVSMFRRTARAPSLSERQASAMNFPISGETRS